MNKLFMEATRQGFRYTSTKGELTTEDLWQLPLQSRTGFDLDTVAKGIHRQLKSMEEESFVTVPTVNTGRQALEAKLEVVKAVIQYKQDQAERQRLRAEKAAEKRRLLELLDSKNQQELEGLSKEEIEKRIAALD